MGLDTRLLNGAEIRELIPQLSGSWRSGLYTAGDAHGEPALSTRTVARAAREAGATIHEKCTVLGVETQGGRVSGIMTARGRCAAPVVVLAGGIGTPALAKSISADPSRALVGGSVRGGGALHAGRDVGPEGRLPAAHRWQLRSRQRLSRRRGGLRSHDRFAHPSATLPAGVSAQLAADAARPRYRKPAASARASAAMPHCRPCPSRASTPERSRTMPRRSARCFPMWARWSSRGAGPDGSI